MKKIFLTLVSLSFLIAQAPDRINKKIDKMADRLEKKVINWRRDFHQNPELSNREFKTAEKVAKHLKSLGIEVETGIAHTGVVGILKGGKPGKVVALRADMDALPVKEKVNLPFASKAKGIYQGNEVDVMHACGHDNHIAGMMGAAEILADIRKDLPGTVKFIFQPAEEGAPLGEEGGATLGVVSTPEYGKVFISIRTNTGNNLSLTQKNNLISQLKQYNVASITPVIVDPDVTQIILQIVFKFDSSKTIKERTELETNVTSTLTTYNIDELTDFVKPFRHSKLTRLVDTTDQAILNSTINVTLAKFITPTLSSSVGYNTSFNNTLYNPHSGHNASAGGILASTGFYVSGDASNVQYFDDDGAGKLRRYYLTGSTRTYQDNAAGTIDYATGEIVINSINITSCADVDGVSSIKFRLTVIPDSKDVVPVRNQVLEIDLANSTVTGQVDTIAVSGADGGSTYTTTSSNTDIQSY